MYTAYVALLAVLGVPVGYFIATPILLLARRGLRFFAPAKPRELDEDRPTRGEALLFGLGMALGVGGSIGSLYWLDDVASAALATPAAAGGLAAGVLWAYGSRRGMPGVSALPWLGLCALTAASAAGASAMLVGRTQRMATATECRHYFEHLRALVLPADQRAAVASFEDADDARTVNQCTRRLTADVARCATRAPTFAAAEACRPREDPRAGDMPDAEICERLAERRMELLTRRAGGATPTIIENVRKATRDSCLRWRRRSAVECAIAAPTLDDSLRCEE